MNLTDSLWMISGFGYNSDSSAVTSTYADHNVILLLPTVFYRRAGNALLEKILFHAIKTCTVHFLVCTSISDKL